MKLFALFCSEFLATVNFQITNIVFVVQNQASLGTAVQWTRETNPVMFGKNVTLTCMVGRKEGCNKTVTRRWDAGPNRNILLLNGRSTNSLKYYEVSEEPCENFSLVIMKFDLKDVNWEYWCSFGFDTSRQMLMLDDQHFIGLPAKTGIYSSLENNAERELNLKISFYKVYPKPKCKMKIGDTSWAPVTVASHSTGILFNSGVHYKTTFPKRQCHNNVNIVCSLLSHTILQLNRRLNCTDKGKPATPDIYSNLENDQKREIHLEISFYKVYPKPKCKMKIGDTSWVPVTVASHPTGMFYNSSVHYKTIFPKRQCHNNVTIVCSLLSHTMLQLNKRLNCTAEDVSRETNYTMQMVIIPVLISVPFIIIMIIGFACFILILKNSKDSQDQKSNIEEMHPLNV